MQPKVSIIIPVYKAEDYLRDCLESIRSQTFRDWECLLVDDGSPDASGIICDEYAIEDNRFIVFHKPNEGVSSARNVGIENMHGEWVIFVDSDDYLPPTAISSLLCAANSNDCDMSFGNYIKINTDNSQISSNSYNEQKLLSIEQFLTLFFHYPVGHFQGYLWNRLMRTSVIINNSLYFNEGVYYKEDGLFLVNYLLLSNKYIAFIPEVVYHYILRTSGAMQSASGKFNYKYFTNLDARIEIYNLVKSSLLSNNLVNMAKESVYDVVRIILARSPKDLTSYFYAFKYISKRLYKSCLMGYVLYKLSKSIVSKYI